MGWIKDKKTIEKYIKVGQKLELESMSIVTKSAQTAKMITKTVSAITEPKDKFSDSMVKFKGDSKRYAFFIMGGVIRFRWGGKREYIWWDGGDVKESKENLVDKYLVENYNWLSKPKQAFVKKVEREGKYQVVNRGENVIEIKKTNKRTGKPTKGLVIYPDGGALDIMVDLSVAKVMKSIKDWESVLK